ncbi:MAG: HPr family phosphocarrier protein [Thermodesulfobacteriota bacterium]
MAILVQQQIRWQGLPSPGPTVRAEAAKAADRELSRTVTVSNELGLHARAASLLARAASEARGPMKILHQGREADCRCILSMIALAVGCGERITVAAEFPDDIPVLDRVLALALGGFGEGEEKEQRCGGSNRDLPGNPRRLGK